eukprot:4293911-Pleurochrysis_carterae.AAC.2
MSSNARHGRLPRCLAIPARNACCAPCSAALKSSTRFEAADRTRSRLHVGAADVVEELRLAWRNADTHTQMCAAVQT